MDTQFYRRHKELDRLLIDHHLCYVFRKYKYKQVFCGHNILTEGVFVTQLSSNAGISLCLKNCVSYDILLFHEHYVASSDRMVTEK
jgi:hypothetical protein